MDADTRQALEAITENTARIREHAAEMSATVRAHLDNHTIHHVPPCTAHESLAKKMWVIIALCLAAMIDNIVDLWK